MAPVAEFNTYDILKQRYLLLTREALAALKERVKEKPARRLGQDPTTDTAPPPHRRAETMVTLRRPPQYRPPRPGPGTVPGHPPPADHREGHAPLGTAQRLHLRGQPAGHQDRDQAGRRGAVQRQGGRRPHPEPPRQAPPPPAQGRPDAELEEGDRRPARRIPDRFLLIECWTDRDRDRRRAQRST